MGTRSFSIVMILFTAFLAPAIDDDLRHQLTDLSARADVLLDVAEKTLWDIGNALNDLQRSATEKARAILMSFPSPHINLTPYVNLAERYWQIIAGLVLLISILFLLKAKLPMLSSGPDWSGYTSEYDIKTKCVEPLLRDWKLSYVSERPCKFRQGHETLEGKIDFYLYDGKGAITIIEDKNTVSGEDELKSARAQARSYCIGLYVFENIVVNSFVIASREGLWIYQIKHNEDHLVERVRPKNLNRSKKRQIKDKLLEIR